jgi:HEAT repeat protein
MAAMMITGSAAAQQLAMPFAESMEATQPVDPDYQRGLSDLDAHQWEQAVSDFSAVAMRKTAGVSDAAIYWKAYAENKLGRRANALASLAVLQQAYPASRWVKDAKALAVEVRAQSGNPVNPGSESDQDLKLIALNSLMQSDPASALPILQKVLASNNPDKLKDRALFILTQNSAPGARQILLDTARGTSNAGLQMKAITYIGMMGGEDARKELASLYSSSSDQRVKSEILKSFMLSGSKTFLLNAAKSEANPELRRQAIKNLALSGGKEELLELYKNSSSADAKREIVKSMFLSGDAGLLAEVARMDKDPSVRAAAVKSMGLMGKSGQPDDLTAIYRADADSQVRKAVVEALFLRQDGKGLVSLARSEKDPAMKAEIVLKMSLVQTPETREYMMEILK